MQFSQACPTSGGCSLNLVVFTQFFGGADVHPWLGGVRFSRAWSFKWGLLAQLGLLHAVSGMQACIHGLVACSSRRLVLEVGVARSTWSSSRSFGDANVHPWLGGMQFSQACPKSGGCSLNLVVFTQLRGCKLASMAWWHAVLTGLALEVAVACSTWSSSSSFRVAYAIHGSVARSSHRLGPKVGAALLNSVVFAQVQVLARIFALEACSSHRLVPEVGAALLDSVVFTQLGVQMCIQGLAACSSHWHGPTQVGAVSVQLGRFHAVQGANLHPRRGGMQFSQASSYTSGGCLCSTWSFSQEKWLQAPCALTPDTDLAQGLVNKVGAGGAPLGSQSSIVTFELGGKHAAFIHSSPVRWQISSSTTSEVRTRRSTVAGDLCTTRSSSRSFRAL